MGVPKFYRWISERYPCLSEVVREYQIPEFDNLYLDMNGIIHNCSHPNDEDVHFRLSEEQVFQDIFRYLEFLFRMIKPQKVFFLAVDGVAPRAKMNQQRGRRFRSAKEAEKREAEARKRGEVLPQEKRFDSNCITPGTEFMDRLHQALKWFIAHKISTDEMWRRVRVILSGHETPGEGEHKIMDFIRYEKSQSNYDANTRHCLYGLDADLIVLGLCSHEPHFSLLREEVKFLKSKPGSKQTARSVNPDVITFHLLHLSLLRNYLDHEFSELHEKLPFGYDIENIIDDWILMGFLVGNDFIPHIPHFHINKNSLVELYRVYMDVLPSLDGYLNENGLLNLPRFEQFLKKVSEIDEDNFMQTYADVKFLQSKSSFPKKTLTRFYNDEDAVDQEISVSKRFAALEACDEDDVGYNKAVTPVASEEEEDQSSDSGASETLNEEFTLHKQHYYETKLELENVDADALRDQAIGYIRAIQWNLHYYYNGCVSWSWFYPHHYAPYISDVRSFSAADLTFERGKPFKPFEQLLAVLPAASKDLLPRAFQRLLTDSNSPIIRHYPEHFELDMNEKQQEWEAVVKISFIDEKELLEVADQCSLLFSSKEKERNVHGPHTEFTFTPDRQQQYRSPLPFLQDVAVNHALVRDIDIDLYRIKPHEVRHGLASGVKLDLHCPGFPTLHFVPHDHRLSREKVKVFEMSSQGENMILTVKSRDPGDMLQLAHECLGNSVFINWPHLLEAKVDKVSDFTFIFSLDEAGRVKQAKLEEKELKEMAAQTKNIARQYKDRKGIEVGATDVVLVCRPITGRTYVPTAAGTVSFEKQWSSIASHAPFQIVVRDISVFDDSFVQFKTVDEIYPIGARCFLLAPSYYGQSAHVIEQPSPSGIKVSISCTAEPDLSEVIQMEPSVLKDHYHPNYVMAQRLGIGGHVLARLTGTVFVTSGNAKVNIGLGLRYNTRGLEVPGFSRKVDEVWLFSNDVGDILKDYSEKFPEVIQNLSTAMNRDVYAVKDIFPGDDGAQRLRELNTWLKSLPSCGAPKQKIGAQVLDQCVVKYIEKLLNTFWTMADDHREMNLTLKPQLLFRPLHFLGYSLPDPAATFELYDRVVNVRDGISVPLGMKGVVTGKHVDEENEVNTVFDVLFDEEFPGGVALRCSPGRGYKMSAANLINISFGRTKSAKTKQNKNICFSALQPAHTPKAQKSQQQSVSGQRGSSRKGEQEFGSRRNGSGQEFAAANGTSSSDVQRFQTSIASSPANRFAAPVAPKQRQQVELNGNKTMANAEKNGFPRSSAQAARVVGELGGTPRPKDNRPPNFVPTQVSRHQKAGHSKTTPVKVVTPQKVQPSSPPIMMTVEMLEQEMLSSVSSPSTAPSDRKASVKRRLAINL